LTIEGPGPPETVRVTGAPTVVDRSIRWARILRAVALDVLRETQRILFRRRPGGERSG